MALIPALLALLVVFQLPGCQAKGEMKRSQYPGGWPVMELIIPAGSTDIRMVSIPGGEIEVKFTNSQRIYDSFELVTTRLREAGWKSLPLNEDIKAPNMGEMYTSPNGQKTVKVYADPVSSVIAWSEAEAKRQKNEVLYRYIIRQR